MARSEKGKCYFHFAISYGSAVDFNGFEYNSSRPFKDLAQRSLRLNNLLSETHSVVTIAGN